MNSSHEEKLTSDAGLLRLQLDSESEEYKDLSDRWRDLDSKAQGVIALTGILLAAFVAFVTGHEKATSVLERLLSVAIVGLLTASMIASVVALWIRSMIGAPHSGLVQEIVRDLLNTDEADRSDRECDLLREMTLRWNECNTEVRDRLEQKTKALKWSQILTAVSIGLLATLAMAVVLR